MRSLFCSVFALSLCMAPIAAAQDEAAMMRFEQAMTAAQAQSARAGDEALTCDQLQTEMATLMTDPAVQSAVAQNGADAQAQLDQMNAAQGQQRAQIGLNIFMGLASAFIPGLGYAQMAQQQMHARQQQQQMEERMAQMTAMMDRMVPIMPQMMRGQRVYELAQAQQCAFLQAQ